MQKKAMTDAKTAITLTLSPAGMEKGYRFLREVCGIDEPKKIALADEPLVLLALFSFCGTIGLSELDAFNLCRKVRGTNGLKLRIQDIGQVFRRGDDQAETMSTPITFNEGRYVNWTGTALFYDVKTGKLMSQLPWPSRFFTAWDVTVNLFDLLNRASQMEQLTGKDR